MIQIISHSHPGNPAAKSRKKGHLEMENGRLPLEEEEINIAEEISICVAKVKILDQLETRISNRSLSDNCDDETIILWI